MDFLNVRIKQSDRDQRMSYLIASLRNGAHSIGRSRLLECIRIASLSFQFVLARREELSRNMSISLHIVSETGKKWVAIWSFVFSSSASLLARKYFDWYRYLFKLDFDGSYLPSWITRWQRTSEYLREIRRGCVGSIHLKLCSPIHVSTKVWGKFQACITNGCRVIREQINDLKCSTRRKCWLSVNINLEFWPFFSAKKNNRKKKPVGGETIALLFFV
jgi:hypothetical protein